MKEITVSLCMIVKDEEEVLERCLACAKPLVDEIIIIDTGSHDKTVEIAQKAGAKIDFFPWREDFAAARNYAFSLAACQYILWLDADDFITAENAERFLALKELLKRESPDMLMCPYEVTADGKPVLKYLRERVLKRSAGFVWQGRVHECIAPKGKVLHSDFCVRHLGSSKPRKDRNLKIYRKWTAEERLDGRNLFYYGRELFYNGFYEEAEKILLTMINGDGWYVNKIEACLVLSQAHAARGDRSGALEALFSSFRFGEPRAKILNEIAQIYYETRRLKEAEFWFCAALLCRDHSEEGDFEEDNARLLTPLLSLCRIAFEEGDLKKSFEYHRRAEELFPLDAAVLYNKNYFETHPIE